MAYVYFTGSGHLNMLLKEENDLRIHRGDVDIIKSQGRLHSISDEDYHSLMCYEKEGSLNDEGNLVIVDYVRPTPDSRTEEEFNFEKNYLLEQVNKTLEVRATELNKPEQANLKTRLENFKANLENHDSSSMSFPVNSSFLRYWIDNESVEPFATSFLVAHQ
tara:strand:+ start:2607 stop:3092 length:486 start_codon:yes stop_codon:yes gene_type:complete